jgi:hypothetical protein
LYTGFICMKLRGGADAGQRPPVWARVAKSAYARRSFRRAQLPSSVPVTRLRGLEARVRRGHLHAGDVRRRGGVEALLREG